MNFANLWFDAVCCGISVFFGTAACLIVRWHRKHPKVVETVRYVRVASSDDRCADGDVLTRLLCGAVIRAVNDDDLARPAVAKHKEHLDRIGILSCRQRCFAFDSCPWVKVLMADGRRDVQLVGRIERKPFDHVEWHLPDVDDGKAEPHDGLSRTVTLLGLEAHEDFERGAFFPQPLPVEPKGDPSGEDGRHGRDASEDGGQDVR